MSLKYKIFADRKLVYVIGKDKISFNDLMKHITELSQDPGYKSPMKKLINYIDATLVELTREESQIFVERKAELKDFFVDELCAIIVANDADFGISRIHGAKIEPAHIQTNVFRDFKNALYWLKVELAKSERDF